MFAGHFGLAAGVRAKSPEVPMWALMLGTQLLDVLFVPLYVSGIEPIDTSLGNGYGKGIIHADYTHSLVGALLIAFLAGLLARKYWGKRAGMILGSIVFSHWLLDLVVHRADMPLLPGNLGHLPLLGLGAWRWPGLSIGLELAMLVFGFGLYLRNALIAIPGARRRASLTSSIALGLTLAFALITDTFGLF